MNYLIDMDGVLADFVGSVLKLFDLTYLKEAWPPMVYNMGEVLGVSNNRIWAKIEAAGLDFWDNLETIPDGMSLVSELTNRGKIIVCTSPSNDPNCATGKVRWLQKQFGSSFRDYMIGPRKELMARNGILVDDYDANYHAFTACGGTAALFAQPWNSKHDQIKTRVRDVLDVCCKKEPNA